MPIFEYLCDVCEGTTEALRRRDEVDAPLVCEHCGSAKTRRAHSVFAAPSTGAAREPLPMAPCGRCGDPQGSCGL